MKEDTSSDVARQKEAWRNVLRQKQTLKGFAKQSNLPNPGVSQSHNKAAGRKGGIRRQGSKRG